MLPYTEILCYYCARSTGGTMTKVDLQSLIKDVLKGIDFKDLVEKCAIYLSNPLVVLDNSCHIVASSKTVSSKDSIWKDATKRGYITVEFSATLDNWNEVVGKDKKYFDVTKISDKRRRFIKLRYNGNDVGYLNILEDKHPLEDLALEEYLYIADLLTKELVFEFQEEKISASSIKEEQIILDLAQGRFIDRTHFLSQTFGTRLDGQHLFHVGLIDFTHYVSYNAGKDTISDSLKTLIPDSFLIFRDKRLLVLMTTPISDRSLLINDFLKEYDLYFALSDGFYDLYNLNRYIKEADAALRLKDLCFNKKRIINYDDVKPYHLLESLSQKDLLEYCDQRVILLNEYDKNHHSELVETLYTYLFLNKSINLTAQKLYAHRNTINYRIQKIKGLIDLDEKTLDLNLYQSCNIIRFLKWREAFKQ